MIEYKYYMRKSSFFFLLALSCTGTIIAQTRVATGDWKEEKQKFILHLKSVSIDSATVYPLARYFDGEIDSIYNSITTDNTLQELEKEKAVRSLVYLITQLGNDTVQQKIDVYDIPSALKSYRDILYAITHHKSFDHLLIPLRATYCQLLAAAFTQYNEHRLLDEVSVYKRIAAAPDFILQFLETKPDFRFADSLVVEAAAHNPAKLVHYFFNGKTGVRERIRKSKNIYVKQIISLSTDRNAAELYPFVIQIAEGRIEPQEILAKRSDVAQYFQLLVNTLKESRLTKDSSSVFIKPLRSGIRQKALSFYVNQINELHSSPDPVRFASVKNLRPEDFYYIMTSCGDELYTSSYIGLYKRLMNQFMYSPADSLFDIVYHDNFPVFLRQAAVYNVAVDFLHKMSVGGMEQSLHRFFTGIEARPTEGLNKAMDIADFFSGLNAAADINGMVETELRSNLNRCRAEKKYLGVKLYSTLLQVFTLVKERKGMNQLWAVLGNYEELKQEALKNKDQGIVELLLFYGDEDGKASFNSFLRSYSDTSIWKIFKTANWVNIRSKTERPIDIYANLPLDEEEEMDLRAQDSLFDFLQQQSLEPSILIHRGHSYHLDKTTKRLTPSVKLAILGSCGGYNHAISIASISPDVQIIGSKKIGSKSINDPLINVINESLLAERGLVWSEIWAKLSARFSKDELLSSLFGEYFSPDNNLSLFVLKLFNL
jgi:hypothetical protein